MSWYNLAKLSQLQDPALNYSEVGHSNKEDGDNPGDCNNLWFYSKNNGLVTTLEEDFLVHSNWNQFMREYNTDQVLFYGRVDTCNWVASMLPVGPCLDSLKSMSPSGLRFCAKRKYDAENAIRKQFGQDIRFRYFDRAEQFA